MNVLVGDDQPDILRGLRLHTHDASLAKRATRVVSVIDGRVVEDQTAS